MFRVIVSTHGVFNAFISRAIDFLAHSTPHFISACQYLPVLLAIHPIAGAITFHISGHATAPVTHPIAHPVAISHIVASHPLSIIGCVAPNHAHTTPDLHASQSVDFAPARNSHPIGAVSASSHPSLLILRCFSVISPSQALVMSSPTCFAHSQNVFAPSLHLHASWSAHTRSSHPDISGQVTF